MKFEYKKTIDKDRLNEFGQEGWELVTVVQLEMMSPMFYMKRRIEEKDEI